MASQYTASWIDKSGEPSSTQLYFPTLNAGNIAAIVDNTPGGGLGDVRLALAGVSLCNFTNHAIQALSIPEIATLPADGNAQREQKVRFDYQDSAGWKGSFSVPGPELDNFAVAGTDFIDLTETSVAALVAAVEANCVSRFGNTITILRGVIVGRNV